MKFYVSFGVNYEREPHPVFWKVPNLPDRLWEVEADDELSLRELLRDRIGNQYAFLYTENTVDFSWFPGGTFTYDIDTGEIELGAGRREENIRITPEQFQRLPRYVQEEIERLNRTINELREHIHHLTEPQPAVAFAGAVGSFGGRPDAPQAKPIMFDKYDVVRIALTGELASDGTVSRGQEYLEISRRDEGWVYVRTSMGRLTFAPEVSNCGWISSERVLHRGSVRSTL